jgi:hypothetical protein
MIQRYDIEYRKDDSASIEADPDGDYVLYTDYAVELRAAEAKCAELTSELMAEENYRAELKALRAKCAELETALKCIANDKWQELDHEFLAKRALK